MGSLTLLLFLCLFIGGLCVISATPQNCAMGDNSTASVTNCDNTTTDLPTVSVTDPTTDETTSFDQKVTNEPSKAIQKDTAAPTGNIPVRFTAIWKNEFQRLHHFSGHYIYNSTVYWIMFVVRYTHPYDSQTLVADFHDTEGGTIMEMNGTSPDNRRVIFTMTKMFSVGERFTTDQEFELDGTLDTPHGVYIGNITKPKNSSFTTFYMESSLGKVEVNTADHLLLNMLLITGLPCLFALLLIILTVGVIIWVYKKGYLTRGRRKAYKLFSNSSVKYEAEAETIHI